MQSYKHNKVLSSINVQEVVYTMSNEKFITKDKIAQSEKRKSRFRPIEDLNLIDNFLFHTVVTQGEDGEEFCRIVLSTILGKKIRKVRVVAQQSILASDTDLHGIRMDAYVEDISEASELLGCEMADAEIVPDIYDIEPNKGYEKSTLPKRMRYYHGLIDSQQLDAGADYKKLPRVIIIVILPYDPFDKNRMVYTVKNQCIEDTSVSYEDGARKIFLYTKGTEGNPSQSLKDMLKYIENTKTQNVMNEDISRIHEFVEKARHRKEVGIRYMNLWEDKLIFEEEVREEVREEIREEVREEIRQELRKESFRVMIEFCREEQISKEDTILKLQKYFKISEGEAKDIVEKY